jgi:3-dehydrosphinganine reductase
MLPWRLVVGGILAIPPMLLQVVLLPLQILLAIPAVWCLAMSKPKGEARKRPPSKPALPESTQKEPLGSKASKSDNEKESNYGTIKSETQDANADTDYIAVSTSDSTDSSTENDATKSSTSSSSSSDSIDNTVVKTHVIITGGSSGIGLEMARWWAQNLCTQDAKPKCKLSIPLLGQLASFASFGADTSTSSAATPQGIHRITLIARNKERLQAAKESIEEGIKDDLEIIAKSNVSKANETGICIQVDTFSVDVSDHAGLQKVADTLATKASSKTDSSTTLADNVYLICCAGAAHPETFEQMPIDVFAQSIQTNQLGPIYTVRAFLPLMHAGHVVLVSSVCGQVGIFGYTSYTPCKFAIRGFAECLSMEIAHRPIHVQVAYPLDTDTPGFARENETKPHLTHQISQVAGLYKPHAMAKALWKQILTDNPRFCMPGPNVDAWMIATLTTGFAPTTNFIETLASVVGMNFFRWLSLFYLNDWWRIVRASSMAKEATVQKKK